MSTLKHDRPKCLAPPPIPSWSDPCWPPGCCLPRLPASSGAGLLSAAGVSHVVTAVLPAQAPDIFCLFSANSYSSFKLQFNYHSFRKVFSYLPSGSVSPCAFLLIASTTAVIWQTCNYRIYVCSSSLWALCMEDPLLSLLSDWNRVILRYSVEQIYKWLNKQRSCMNKGANICL